MCQVKSGMNELAIISLKFIFILENNKNYFSYVIHIYNFALIS